MVERCGTLERQRMDGDAVRGKRHDLFQRVGESGKGIRRQPRDQIHVDVIKAHVTREPECINCLLCRVASADRLQNAVL